MANDVASDRVWILDTAAEIKGVGVDVFVDHLYFVPAAHSNACTIQEYNAAGALRTAAYIKAGGTDASPVSESWADGPRLFNGFKLSAITAGVLYVYLA